MKAIVCVNNNFGISKDGKIPWKSKKDLLYFKSIVIGNGNNAVVMCYNTFLSLNKKPLKNRFNYVLTSNHFYNLINYENIKFINNLKSIILIFI